MPNPYWPLADLVVRTPPLVVRLPTDAELVDLARLAASGVHVPETMPFAIPWTDAPSPRLERAAMQWWWQQRAEWSPARWTFTGGVFVGGRAVGIQDLSGVDFTLLRTVGTGSWLGRDHQGQGLGTEMRAAVLHLAFVGLGAVEAHSGAWEDNAASIRVSRKLGYVDNGIELRRRRDGAARHLMLRLDRTAWEANRRDDISIEGLNPCRELFGLPAGA
ncbi:MAG: GNAT family N-acetyltransferase [Candidatus Dormibacteraeota bacterium]|nr:GNAT family N-acetyltransferase [Candidatus Dormibacteraeota bacterium]